MIEAHDCSIEIDSETNPGQAKQNSLVIPDANQSGDPDRTFYDQTISARAGIADRDNQGSALASEEGNQEMKSGGQKWEGKHLPSGGQPKKTQSALKRAKERKSNNDKVLDFSALKRAREGKKRVGKGLLSVGQGDENWLKAILPSPKSGAWWEIPADDRGFKIKLRWRAGRQKPVYTFRRLGKHELQTLMEKTYGQQQTIIADRIFGEIFEEGRRDLALRFEPFSGNNQIADAEDSQISRSI